MREMYKNMGICDEVYDRVLESGIEETRFLRNRRKNPKSVCGTEILWNDIVGEDILYDVYVCTAKNNEKCKCDTSKLCKHYKKLTTTKKTSCVMTKWPKGKKLDLTKDKIIWIKIRAKKKIDGKWIVSNCLNTFVNEDDIK